MLVIVLVCSASFANILMRKKNLLLCFNCKCYILLLLMFGDSSSVCAVCDCGISRSYSLTFRNNA